MKNLGFWQREWLKADSLLKFKYAGVLGEMNSFYFSHCWSYDSYGASGASFHKSMLDPYKAAV